MQWSAPSTELTTSPATRVAAAAEPAVSEILASSSAAAVAAARVPSQTSSAARPTAAAVRSSCAARPSSSTTRWRIRAANALNPAASSPTSSCLLVSNVQAETSSRRQLLQLAVDDQVKRWAAERGPGCGLVALGQRGQQAIVDRREVVGRSCHGVPEHRPAGLGAPQVLAPVDEARLVVGPQAGKVALPGPGAVSLALRPR
jgi:hypothetical protein